MFTRKISEILNKDHYIILTSVNTNIIVCPLKQFHRFIHRDTDSLYTNTHTCVCVTSNSTVSYPEPLGLDVFQNPELYRFQKVDRVHMPYIMQCPLVTSQVNSYMKWDK